MYLNDLLKAKREDILRLAEAYGASDVRVLAPLLVAKLTKRAILIYW